MDLDRRRRVFFDVAVRDAPIEELGKHVAEVEFSSQSSVQPVEVAAQIRRSDIKDSALNKCFRQQFTCFTDSANRIGSQFLVFPAAFVLVPGGGEGGNEGAVLTFPRLLQVGFVKFRGL